MANDILPFTRDQFFQVFGAYNRSLWLVALALWLYALAGVVVLARPRGHDARFIPMLLAVQWAWAGIAYHMAFFSTINPAAWLFGGLFLAESVLFAWFGLVRPQLRFTPGGSPRHILAWLLMIYSLIYPLIALAEGHRFPEAPTFGIPCPTAVLTIGLLFAADPPWPRTIALIPLLWAVVGGSASVLIGVYADLVLWAAAVALMGYLLVPGRLPVRA